MIRRKFDQLTEWIVALFFASFVVVMVLQVFGRTFFNYSFFWSVEYSRYSFAWMIMFASAIAVKQGAHMGFDLVIIKLSEKMQRLIAIINHILVLIFLGVFIYVSVDLMKVSGMAPSPSMHIPMAYVYLVLPLSGIFMIIYVLLSIKDIVLNQSPDRTEESDV